MFHIECDLSIITHTHVSWKDYSNVKMFEHRMEEMLLKCELSLMHSLCVIKKVPISLVDLGTTV